MELTRTKWVTPLKIVLKKVMFRKGMSDVY
jgi:hypothetical protein